MLQDANTQVSSGLWHPSIVSSRFALHHLYCPPPIALPPPSKMMPFFDTHQMKSSLEKSVGTHVSYSEHKAGGSWQVGFVNILNTLLVRWWRRHLLHHLIIRVAGWLVFVFFFLFGINQAWYRPESCSSSRLPKHQSEMFLDKPLMPLIHSFLSSADNFSHLPHFIGRYDFDESTH